MKVLLRLVDVLLLLVGLTSSQATRPVPSPNATAPMVDLGYVKYQGTTSTHKGIDYFHGIQYISLDDSTTLTA